MDSVPDGKICALRPREPSAGRPPFRFSLFSKFPKGLGHVEEAGFVFGVGDLLRQLHAFRGIPTVIDSGKRRQQTLPTRSGKITLWPNGSVKIRITILLKNKVPKLDVAFAGTVEATVLDSEKYRKYAADCVRIAREMSGKDRQALLEIAEAWEMRAREAEKKEKRQRNLGDD